MGHVWNSLGVDSSHTAHALRHSLLPNARIPIKKKERTLGEPSSSHGESSIGRSKHRINA